MVGGSRLIHQLDVEVRKFSDVSIDLQAQLVWLSIVLQVGVVGDN
jgi:hypothetical protein